MADTLKDYAPISNIGSYLAMKKSSEETYVELPGVSRVPDLFGDPAEIDATSVKLGRKRTVAGVEDISALDFEFFWDNSATDTSYRRLKAAEDADENMDFKLVYPDGTTFTWSATIYTKPLGFGSGEALKFTAKLYVTSEDITITDPVGA